MGRCAQLMKYLLERRAARLRRIAQAREHRGDEVFLIGHSIAWRYGDLGFSTRSIRA